MSHRRDRLVAACCAVLLGAGCSLPWSKPVAPHPHPSPTPPPPIATGFLLNGTPISGSVQVGARDHLQAVFSRAAPVASDVTVLLDVDGRALPAAAITWNPERTAADIPLSGLLPYQPALMAIAARAPVEPSSVLQVTMLATVPANSTTGVPPGFQPHTPIAIAVENSGPARPQSGLQDADIVYEYLSEYSVTRMTAIYFAHIPSQVGPVRSCRMINPYLGYAYSAMTVCSGVSDGTGGYIVGTTPGSQPIATLMEGNDTGGRLFRVGFNAAPHNLYTSGDRAEALRTQLPLAPGQFAVDPPHPSAANGTEAGAPSVPLHGVSYVYDAGSRQYLRFDHGTPFFDRVTGQQIHAENVVLMHVPFHDAGWVEDENGGAHSVWYDMLGSGPAEVYSEGRLIRATWHMGAAGQRYFDNRTPVWFTDESGKVVLLNTGLTWIHVLGNGQEQCPQSPADCH